MAEYIYQADPIGDGEYSHTLVGELVRCRECINAPVCGHFVMSMPRGGGMKFHHLSYCSYGERRADDES